MKLEGKNVFLSGPMSDYVLNNADGFAKAHAMVRMMGAREIYDPAEAWLRQPLADDDVTTHEEYVRRCVHELTRPAYCGRRGPHYDVLVSLPGWQDSEGAFTERAAALDCGIECVDLERAWDGFTSGQDGR